MLTLQELKTKVEKRISDYIEFDVNEIFNIADYITIYGGAVRDSIANLDIHDVDILCMTKSAIKLTELITEKYNYEKLDLYDQDALNMYKGIHIISEPLTFMNNNKKIIQIIKPTYSRPGAGTDTNDYKLAYTNLIKNVDISCCGVYLDHNGKETILMEACKDAIIHCLSKTYEINEWSKLYNNDRTTFRNHKLAYRGWVNLNREDFFNSEIRLSSIAFKKAQRRLKISQLEFQPEEGEKYYRIWNKEEYENRPKRATGGYDGGSDDLPF